MNLSQLMRLLDYDTSSEFKIIVTINENEQKYDTIEINKETHITINTTVNKARIISKNIDELYISDQATNQFEIKLNNIQDENLTRKVVDVFDILMKSIGQEMKIPEELQFIFIIIEHYLGEDFDGTNSKNNDNVDGELNNFDNIFNDNNNNNENDDDGNRDDENNELGYSDLLFMYKLK